LAAARLRQMKSLAHKFSSTYTHLRDDSKARTTVRPFLPNSC
jgi:hypothetical protein